MPYQAMSLKDFALRFPTQEACLSAIIARRWPTGWTCPNCGEHRCYRLHNRRALECANRLCRAQVSITRRFVFEQLKTPLLKIFLAIYLMIDKQGISAMELAKHLDVAFNTAFNLLPKLRLAMCQCDRGYALGGVLQVDEAYVGSHGDGRHPSGRSIRTKRLIGVAVEQRASNVTGYIHVKVLLAADAESLHGMILDKVRRGSRLLTDDWRGYRGIAAKGYDRDPVPSYGGHQACEQWPLVHRAVANGKTWLLETHRNFCRRRLPAYAAQYYWRANRRNVTRADYAANQRERFLPDRLLTLACNHCHLTPAEVRAARHSA